MKTYVIGDIHGYLKPLEQCLKRSKFNFEKDQLICLGDVADRGPQTYECFELLLRIKNLVYILGNHDYWLLQYFNFPKKKINQQWYMSGGKAAILSYQKNSYRYQTHQKLLQNAHLYYLDDSNRLFVHGGFNMNEYLAKQTDTSFCWDRTVWQAAQKAENNITYQLNNETAVKNNTIFIGHTTTHRQFPDLLPQKFVNVWNLDQGAGHGYKLTIMNIENFNYWQSDLVMKLYKFQQKTV